MFKKKKTKKRIYRESEATNDGEDSNQDSTNDGGIYRDNGVDFNNKTNGGDDVRKTKVQKTSSVLFNYAAGGTAPKQRDDAFRTNEYETTDTRDQRALHEEKLNLMQSGGTNDETGLYKGMNAYSGIIAKSADSIRANKSTGAHGALRANTFVRTTSRFDYQPDICKDYKETGFCGFGDTCVFLHDRGDSKKGWELEAEWEEKQREKKEMEEKAMRGLLGEVEEEGEQQGDKLPFACGICRSHFKEPITTVCGHYYCSKCAREKYKVDKACAGCGGDTGGVFNEPRKLKKICKEVAGGDWKVFWERKGGKVKGGGDE